MKSSANRRPVVGVFCGLGAVTPLEAVTAGPEKYDVLLVFDSSTPYGHKITELMKVLPGPTIDVAGRDPKQIASELRARGVDGIVTFAEEAMILTAEVAWHGGYLYHSRDTTARLRSKIQQRESLNQAGVSHTSFRGIRAGTPKKDLLAEVRRLGFPSVIKPEFGTASRNTYRLDSAHELSRLVASNLINTDENCIVEEFIEGMPHPSGEWLADYVAVEVLAQGGEYLLMSVTDKPPLTPPLRETGALTPSTLPSSMYTQLLNTCISGLRALGAGLGIFHCELKLTSEGPRIIEINGRLGGPVNTLLTYASNLRPIEFAFDVALGRTVAYDARFHQFALQVDIVPPLGATRLLAGPVLNELRRVPHVTRVQAYVESPARVYPTLGEIGKILSIWIVDPDLMAIRNGLTSVNEVCRRTLFFDNTAL